MTGRGPGPTVPATPRPTSPPDAGAQSEAPRRAAGPADEQAPDEAADAPAAGPNPVATTAAAAPATVPSAEPEPPSVSDGDPAPARGATEGSGRSEDAEPTPYAGPPDDAATTFEDLPGDLFGEPEPPPEPAPGPAPARSDASPASNGPRATGPRSTAPHEGAPRSSAAPRRSRPTDAADAPADGSPAAETSAGGEPAADPAADPAIDMVQTFFPGRIVALQPAAEGADDDAPETETADVRPDAEADGGPDDGAARPSG
ncbi:MAG: hypothetical protein R6V44_00380 [Paracoccaceae bacterium]